MENFKNHIKPFGFLKKEPVQDPMAPKFIKPDGTEVIEQQSPTGLTVYEINRKKGILISRSYIGNDTGKLWLDYARKSNYEIGHKYDEFGQKIYEFETFYEGKNLKWKKETEFEYHDNGTLAREFKCTSNSQVQTEIFYDETGKHTSKIEYHGSVKTYFDENDKPVKREIDRGTGGIITEDLTGE